MWVTNESEWLPEHGGHSVIISVTHIIGFALLLHISSCPPLLPLFSSSPQNPVFPFSNHSPTFSQFHLLLSFQHSSTFLPTRSYSPLSPHLLSHNPLSSLILNPLLFFSHPSVSSLSNPLLNSSFPHNPLLLLICFSPPIPHLLSPTYFPLYFKTLSSYSPTLLPPLLPTLSYIPPSPLLHSSLYFPPLFQSLFYSLLTLLLLSFPLLLFHPLHSLLSPQCFLFFPI